MSLRIFGRAFPLWIIGGSGLVLLPVCAEGGPDRSVEETCSTSIQLVSELGSLDDPASIKEPVFVDIAPLPDDGWVVAGEGTELLEYSSDGLFRRFFGSRGEGPGELQAATRVVVDAFDSLWVSSNRGRVVLFGPDGQPARTMLRPELYRIDGFTPSGLPYSMLTRDSGGQRPEPLLFGLAQVWSRGGERLDTVGPGHFDPNAKGRIVLPLIPPQSQPVNDTVFYTPGDWENWIFRWTPSSEQALLPATTVWQEVGLGDGPNLPEDNHPIAVTSDGKGGYWVIGAIRRISRDRELALHEAEADEAGPQRSPFWRFSPSVRREAYDGVLVHLSGAGEVTEGAAFDEYPFGFIDQEHFFTFQPLSTGLIQIRIWQFRQNCS